jgi:hypothetical protein
MKKGHPKCQRTAQTGAVLEDRSPGKLSVIASRNDPAGTLMHGIPGWRSLLHRALVHQHTAVPLTCIEMQQSPAGKAQFVVTGVQDVNILFLYKRSVPSPLCPLSGCAGRRSTYREVRVSREAGGR